MRVGPLKKQTELPREEIFGRMIEVFEQDVGRNLVADRLSPEELREAEKLAQKTYGSRDWLYSIP